MRPTIQPIHKNKNSSKNMLGYQKKFQKTCKAIRKNRKKDYILFIEINFELSHYKLCTVLGLKLCTKNL